MTSSQVIQRNFLEHAQSVEATKGALSELILIASKVLAQSLLNGGTVFWCGNGGSASDSQHMAAELVGRFKRNRRPLRSMALNADTSVLTCVANDFSYENIFSRQLEAHGRSGDILVGISTSGQSENILKALKTAKDMGIATIGLLGKGGGDALVQVDHALVVPSDTTARIQESHILIGHILCELIEIELGIS
ncbi:MAG: SIS domain-containing protein [Porticoccus sp.]|nr:SIS domain-containing protein [Porticoccus sp.]